MKKKVFNYSELHFSEVTSYKIHTILISLDQDLKQVLTLIFYLVTSLVPLIETLYDECLSFSFQISDNGNLSLDHDVIFKKIT